MQFFSDTHIDFMKYRKHFVVVSGALLVVSIFAVFVHGKLNLGIDFAGGTQLTLKFRGEPEIQGLRDSLAAGGLNDAQIQRFGGDEANEVMVKTPLVEGSEEGSRDRIVSTLDSSLNPDRGDALDVNRVAGDAMAELLLREDPDQLAGQDAATARAHYDEVAAAIISNRQSRGVFAEFEELRATPGLSPEAAVVLEQLGYLGQFGVVGAENVGPQIGSELRQKGILAVLTSLFGMLLYIWVRFELRFGIGALVALVHDVVIVLGLYALADFEFDLTTIAAFLTLVGYSVNDSVVVFDRVRENLRRRRSEPLVDILNRSVNQTLSRTVLTSGTTLLAVGSLLFAGGDVLRGFAFILTVGVIVGTYSSIYVASPFTLLWEQTFGREARSRRRTEKAA